VVEMDWWQVEAQKKQDLDESRITFLPAQHFSARGITDRNKTLWWGFRLEIREESLYFAWDTGYGEFVEHIRERYQDGFTYGLIPIGAYKPRWFMAPVHTDPYEGMQIQRDLRIKKL
jgi:L-ascorbate metabolism protein UlaG (beta-lactamase superfamily)